MKPVKEVGDWSEQTSSNGKRYYYNRSTEVSQWEKPEEWKEYERKIEEYERMQKRQQSMPYSNNARPQATVSSAQIYQGGYLVTHPPPPPPPTTTTINLQSVTGHSYSNPYGPGPLAPQLSFPMNNVSQHIVATTNSSSPKAHPGHYHNAASGLNNREREGTNDYRLEREKERDKDAGFRERKRPYPRNSPREKDRENREFHQKERDRDRENFRELNTNAHVLTSYRNAGSVPYQHETNDNPSSSNFFENKHPKVKMEEKARYGDERAAIKFPRGIGEETVVKHVNGSAVKHAPSNDFDNRDVEGGSVPMDIEEERTESNNSIHEEAKEIANLLVAATDRLKNFKKRFPSPKSHSKVKDTSVDEERLQFFEELGEEKKRLIDHGKMMLKLYQTQALSQMCRVKAEVLNIRLKSNREVQKWIESRRMGNSIAVSASSTTAMIAAAGIAGLSEDLNLSNVMSSPLRLDNYT